RRRVRAARTSDAPGMGDVHIGPVRGSRREVLLQAMGWCTKEEGRPDVERQNLRRDAGYRRGCAVATRDSSMIQKRSTLDCRQDHFSFAQPRFPILSFTTVARKRAAMFAERTCDREE